jgi:hypothetical protein
VPSLARQALATYLSRTRARQPALPKAVLTNFNRTGDAILSPHVEPDGYTLIPLPDGRHLAVLGLADPTHLAATYPEYAARFTDFWPPVARTLATLRRLPQPPDVVALVISAFPLTNADVANAGSTSAADERALQHLVHNAIGVDIFIISTSEMSRSEPHVRYNYAGDAVLVVPPAGSFTHGRLVANVSATFTDAGLLVPALSSASEISLDCHAPEHAHTAHRLATWHAHMDVRMGVTLGRIMPLDSSTRAQTTSAAPVGDAPAPEGCSRLAGGVVCGCRVGACKQGSFVADALVHETGADFALINGGAIWSSITPLMAGGGASARAAVSTGDLIELLPFGNEIIRLSLTGAQIRAALTSGISRLSTSGPTAASPKSRPRSRSIGSSSTASQPSHTSTTMPTAPTARCSTNRPRTPSWPARTCTAAAMGTRSSATRRTCGWAIRRRGS